MTAPNDTHARLTVIEHYLAIVIAGQLNLHDDALAQLEAEDLGWQAQLAGSEAAIRARFDALDPRPPPKRIESDIAALLDGLDAVHTAFLGQVRQLLPS